MYNWQQAIGKILPVANCLLKLALSSFTRSFGAIKINRMDATLYNALLHAHSIGRWIVLVLLLFAIVNSLLAGRRPFIRSDNRLGLLLTIFSDLMLVIGIALYVFGPRGYKVFEAYGNNMGAVMKDSAARFYGVEHIAGMLIAIVLIHIGKAQARKPIGDRAKHRRTMLFYLLALLIILVSIPWPFRAVAGHWY